MLDDWNAEQWEQYREGMEDQDRLLHLYLGCRTVMAVGYVLVNVSPGKEFETFQTINNLENVKDATMLFGDYDIIAKLEADSLGDVARIVDIIRQIPGVTDSKTFAGADY